MALEGYYNRFNSAKKYVKTMFIAHRGLQSAELNEIQEYTADALKRMGNALFANGDVISGCTCVVDSMTGNVKIESGQVYLEGLIRDVHEGEFTIPNDKSVRIGVYYKEKTITSLEDASLRNPALGTRGYQEEGAARVQYQTTWGYQIVGSGDASSELGQFYPIYNVENGVLVQKAAAPQLDSVNTALARYDDESNGSYVVRGMKVTCLYSDLNGQMFSVNEGKAHVNGYEVGLDHTLRVKFENDFDLQTVESDPYVFSPNVQGKMTINLNYTPLAEIKSVDITAEKKANLTHGSYNGCMDPIPNQSVLQIISIKQGTTVYQNGTDFKLTQGQVDWSPAGAEPAPGSSYEIIYRHRTQVTPTNVTDTSFEISGGVDGTMVLVSYTWKMPRYDLITIDSEGIVRRVKGLAHPWSPSIPKAPTGQLTLALIHQTWGDKPEVSNNAIRVTSMADIESMKTLINNLYYLVAQQNLKIDANASDPSTKKGVFVDPFYDDDMRDQGVEQTGAIVNESLQLPIHINVLDYLKEEDLLLPYELEPVISQEARTGFMRVNPYDAFDPIPTDVTLKVDIDNWTEIETQWLSPITNYYYQYNWWGWEHMDSSSKNDVTSTTNAGEYMRQATQKFTVEGQKPGEKIAQILFNGIDITASNIEEGDE